MNAALIFDINYNNKNALQYSNRGRETDLRRVILDFVQSNRASHLSIWQM